MRTKQIFVVVFLILSFLPALLFDFKSTVSKTENRALATLPTVEKNNVFNMGLFSELDKYFNDRFGLRRNLLTLNKKFDGLHITSKSAKALRGKQGWLFYIDKNDGDNLQDFLKANLVSQQEVDMFANNIKMRADWCSTNGIKFIFLIAPNKHTIYPEFYPLEAPSGVSRTEQFTKAMAELGINYIYPKELLLSSKLENSTPLYYRLGTHWNDLGVHITYQQALLPMIKKLLGSNAIANIEFEYVIEDIVGGDRDIVPMLGIADNSTQQIVGFQPKAQQWNELYKLQQLDETGREGIISENYNKQLPKAIVFRDSFFSSLVPFTSTVFSKAEYKWKLFEDTDKEYILQNKPDIIIFEIVERHLPMIVGKGFK